MILSRTSIICVLLIWIIVDYLYLVTATTTIKTDQICIEKKKSNNENASAAAPEPIKIRTRAWPLQVFEEVNFPNGCSLETRSIRPKHLVTQSDC